MPATITTPGGVQSIDENVSADDAGPTSRGEVAGVEFRSLLRTASHTFDSPMRVALPLIVVGALLGTGPSAEAAGTGFDPRPIVVGQARQEIKRLPIQERPNRPLHVYGNAVRRRFHRGAMPLPR